jgi:hypothetical protein
MTNLSPWTKAEKKLIADFRKEGRDDSYICGSMKLHRASNQIPQLPSKEMPMATKKKAVKKAAPRKESTKRPGRKKGDFKLGDTITAVKGLDDNFYKQFPRYKAYELLCKKGKMKTDTFISNVEKLEGVKNRNQALGILTKLVDKGCATMSGVPKKASTKKAPAKKASKKKVAKKKVTKKKAA